MEVGEIQTQAYKFPRIGNGISRNIDSTKIGPDDEDQDGGHRHRRSMTIAAAVGGAGGGNNRLRGWNHSRIIRVSRSSGGKDRHSKVLTSKGLRDRRVRLSVATAIQFYDIQDRLGYDQPSKAVEWLIEAARASIAELPSLSGSFPETPRQFSDEKRGSDGAEQEHGLDSAEADLDGEPSFQQQQNQNLSLSKSACSSTSETSKGSGLSLSRSEIRDNRVRARERARERAAKEKEKDTNHHNLNPVSHNSSSFTELLTGAISTVNTNTTTATNTTSSPSGDGGGEVNIFHKAARQWSSPSMEYFTTGLLGAQLSRAHHHHPSVFSGQIPMGNTNSVSQVMQVPAFTISAEGGNHQELPQHFSFVPDHLIPVAAAPSTTGLEYNLNVSISSASSASSGLGGFTRGTLQSNSSTSLLPHQLQRFSSSPIDGPNVPFFIGTATPVDTSNHHQHHQHHHHHHHHHPNNHIAQFPSGFDGRLQLCYGDPPPRQSDQKVKPKN